MNILELRKELSKEMSYIPNWINTTSSLHHGVWCGMGECNDLLLILMNDKVLSKRSIDVIVIKFDDLITSLIEVLIEEEQIKLCIYYTALLELMKERTLEEERYEACSNIQKFYDIYFTNLYMKNEE